MRRRDFLKLAALSGAALLSPAFLGPAWASGLSSARRGVLHVYNINTMETLTVSYLDEYGRFDLEGLETLNRLFRCRMTDKYVDIDPRLFLLMDTLHTKSGALDMPITLVCGYRSPEYNRLRSSYNAKVASNSYHVLGMAADISIDGVELKDIKQDAVDLSVGGVGKYSKFVHVDVGPVRTW